MTALDLLSGDAQTFVSKVWASDVLIHRTDPAGLVGLLSFDDVDALLTSTAIRTPAVRVAQEGTVLPPSAFTRPATLAGQSMTGLIDPGRIFALFDQGATIVLQGLHRYWPKLGALVAELELELGHPCQANAYLTPPASQGFAVHQDSHDVFVFSTHGRKVWEVGDHRQPDAERQSVVLEPGVSMYLPTGTPHAARSEESVSLHVTVGINQLTWRRVVERALADALDEGGSEHLPAGYLDDPGVLAEGLGSRLEALARAVREVDPAVVADAEVRRFLTGRTLWQRGGLRDRIAARDLADDTVVRRRAGHPCVLVPHEGRLRILLGDRELVVPAHLEPALKAIRSADQLRPADLGAPDRGELDPQSRVVLCRRLVREGLLEIIG